MTLITRNVGTNLFQIDKIVDRNGGSRLNSARNLFIDHTRCTSILQTRRGRLSQRFACKEIAQSRRSAHGSKWMRQAGFKYNEERIVTSHTGTNHARARRWKSGGIRFLRTNFVIVLYGALLQAAETLLHFGVTESCEEVLEVPRPRDCQESKDVNDVAEVKNIWR